MGLGYRQSTESWAGVLRDLRHRGLDQPPAARPWATALWACGPALRDVFPTTAHQRCWNHKALNELDRLPRRLQPEVVGAWSASTRAVAERERDRSVAWLGDRGQADAAATLLRDWDDLVAFYDYPAEHWRHLRTSNVGESVFAGVRCGPTCPSARGCAGLRNDQDLVTSDVPKRARVRENALYLVCKIVERLGSALAPAQRRRHAHDPVAHGSSLPRRDS